MVTWSPQGSFPMSLSQSLRGNNDSSTPFPNWLLLTLALDRGFSGLGVSEACKMGMRERSSREVTGIQQMSPRSPFLGFTGKNL